MSTDKFYTKQGQEIKRFMLSNTIDARFYKKIPDVYDEQSQIQGPSFQRPGAEGSQNRCKSKIMRDPYEFINFFKQNVYHEVDDLYHDFLEDIKILRENHVMIKGHERAAGKNYMNIGKKFKGHLQ